MPKFAFCPFLGMITGSCLLLHFSNTWNIDLECSDSTGLNWHIKKQQFSWTGQWCTLVNPTSKLLIIFLTSSLLSSSIDVLMSGCSDLDCYTATSATSFRACASLPVGNDLASTHLCLLLNTTFLNMYFLFCFRCIYFWNPCVSSLQAVIDTCL